MRLERVVLAYRRARRLAILRESTAPLVGPFYWIPIPYDPGYDLLSYPESAYGYMDHDQVWRRYVVPYLQDIWKLTDPETRGLLKYEYGLPRGRVSKSFPASEGIYYLNHGNDSQLPRVKAISMILREMNLVSLRHAGKLKIVFDNHERTLPQHKLRVEPILAAAKTRMGK